MKNKKLIMLILCLTLSKIFIIPGFINILLTIVTKADLQFNYWWLVSAIGLLLSIICLIFLLLLMLKNRQSALTMSSKIRSPYLRQIVFSFINIGMSMGVGIFSTIVALVALNNVINAPNASNGNLKDSKLRKAKLLNIVAIILVVAQWLAIALFIGSIQQVG